MSREKLFVPNISARSWIAYEMNSGKVIYGKRINKKREMASLTKIMNLITAI
jgi:D-alanyl-D-alanine carboxypeptidase